MLNNLLCKFHDDFFNNKKHDSHFKDSFVKSFNHNNELIVKSSFGITNRAIVPWIAMHDSTKVKTIQEGYYLVYLFTADQEGVYLSLNQGIARFKENIKILAKEGYDKKWKQSIEEINVHWRDVLLSDLPLDHLKIDLKLPKNRITAARGYECGNIVSKYYKLEDIKSEVITNEQILSDLNLYLSYYYKLISEIGAVSHSQWNISFCQNVILYSEETVKPEKSVKPHGIREVQMPSSLREKKGLKNPVSRGKPDWNKIRDHQNKLGKEGEKAALEFIKAEKEKLNNDYQKDLVRHASELDGDGLGYDILEIDELGVETHIEVKTTRKGINEPFFVSCNELEYSMDEKNNFLLFRIFNYIDINNFDYYIVKGSLRRFFDFEPTNYISASKKLEEL